jgi:UrcA family protein
MQIKSIALALAAASVALPAAAADAPRVSVRVEYSDLDLATPAGQEELERRLDRAARTICGVDNVKTGTRLPSSWARRCMREARIDLDRQFAALIERHSSGG